MKNDAQKYTLFLVIAGLVLVTVNVAVWMGTKNGQLAPIDNQPLWGAFVVLNVCSLLWAVSLMGLQPMVVAFSYVAGGFLAFQGVRLLPEVNIAEVTTAGATYGAFGALAVGNATTKVRLAFFRKGQVPFVLIIVALLVMDGFLNSRVSNAGWSVIVRALIFPFMLSGVTIGLIWMVLTRFGIGQGSSRKTTDAVSETHVGQELSEESPDQAAQLMIKVPDAIEVDEEREEMTAAMEGAEHNAEPEAAKLEVAEEPAVSKMVEEDSMGESFPSADFFPLEIDKDDDFVLPQEDSNLMDVASMVAEGTLEQAVEALEAIEEEIILPDEPSSGMESIITVAEVASEPVEEAIEDSGPAPVADTEETDGPTEAKEEVGSADWLNGHLDLLNKLK